jgi:hypothetical protein
MRNNGVTFPKNSPNPSFSKRGNRQSNKFFDRAKEDIRGSSSPRWANSPFEKGKL